MMLASWLESLSEMFTRRPDAFVACVVVLCTLLCAAILVIAIQWQKTRQTEIEADLKRDMLERGLSPDEIERVIKATSQTSPDHKRGRQDATRRG